MEAKKEEKSSPTEEKKVNALTLAEVTILSRSTQETRKEITTITVSTPTNVLTATASIAELVELPFLLSIVHSGMKTKALR